MRILEDAARDAIIHGKAVIHIGPNLEPTLVNWRKWEEICDLEERYYRRLKSNNRRNKKMRRHSK